MKEKSVEELHELAKGFSEVCVTPSKNNCSKYAGFWDRFFACIIDSFIVIVVITPIGFVIGLFFDFILINYNYKFVKIILNILSIIFYFSYNFGYDIFMVNKYQATLGKMAMGIKVEGEDGRKLSLFNIILRETIGKITSIFIFGIGFLMVVFTSKKQALHDIIADSVVVRKSIK